MEVWLRICLECGEVGPCLLRKTEAVGTWGGQNLDVLVGSLEPRQLFTGGCVGGLNPGAERFGVCDGGGRGGKCLCSCTLE